MSTDPVIVGQWIINQIPSYFLQHLDRSYSAFFGAACAAIGTSNFFIYGSNAFFANQEIQPVRTIKLPSMTGTATLDPKFLPEFLAWYEEHQRHLREWGRVEQTLSSILLRAKDLQDLRDMLPEHVVAPIIRTSNILLTRTRPDLYAGVPPPTKAHIELDSKYLIARKERELYWDSRLLDMYERIGGIIDLYMGYRLL